MTKHHPSHHVFAIIFPLSFLTVLLLCAPPATAEPMVYPANGQSPEQRSRDMQQCRQWAIQESGVDPATLTPMPNTPQAAGSGQRKVLRGAAAGAAVGGLGGSMGGEFGKGAAAGALAGAVVGGIRQRREARTNESLQAQAQARQQQMNNRFERAYRACLQGRGYTVN